MASVAAATRHTYVDRESLNHALTSDLVGWTVSETHAPRRLFSRTLCHIAWATSDYSELSGNPFRATHSRSEISADSDAYLGVLYQKSGSTLCKSDDDRLTVGPGEIGIWYSRRPLSFEMPERFDKLCMIIPIARGSKVYYTTSRPTKACTYLPAVTWLCSWRTLICRR